ncbi:hypothetical protein [Demequina sp.]|uniref:hypothetical protein n=1 Tax=Demequina sp. TaxID=2050685 RepID=UPI003A88216A
MSGSDVEWPALVEGEFEVDNVDERLWRQVHPDWVQDGVISSSAFKPKRNDGKQLSCSRESIVSAAEATRHYGDVLGFRTAGSAAVSVGDVHTPDNPVGPTATVSARVVDDSERGATEGDLPPGHAYVDLRPFGSSAIERKAKQLAFFAAKNGLESKGERPGLPTP